MAKPRNIPDIMPQLSLTGEMNAQRSFGFVSSLFSCLSWRSWSWRAQKITSLPVPGCA